MNLRWPKIWQGKQWWEEGRWLDPFSPAPCPSALLPLVVPSASFPQFPSSHLPPFATYFLCSSGSSSGAISGDSWAQPSQEEVVVKVLDLAGSGLEQKMSSEGGSGWEGRLCGLPHIPLKPHIVGLHCSVPHSPHYLPCDLSIIGPHLCTGQFSNLRRGIFHSHVHWGGPCLAFK